MTLADLWQIALALVTAGAIYGGIRADLRGMHERVAAAQDAAARAHDRIDECIRGCRHARGD